jgi:hypothetical protein
MRRRNSFASALCATSTVRFITVSRALSPNARAGTVDARPDARRGRHCPNSPANHGPPTTSVHIFLKPLK